MSIIDLLHNLLKEKIPGIHATRLQALMAAVQAGLKGASVSITAQSGPGLDFMLKAIRLLPCPEHPGII
jgi:hypothetical protein